MAPSNPSGPTPAERRVTDLPPAKHGDPAENLGVNESVLGVRVGSEATVESGTGPVLPLSPGGGVSEATRVKNKDLLERDKKEREKRGPVGGTRSISVNFEGLMMVQVDGRDPELKSGSFTGDFVEKVEVRALTAKEMDALTPKPAPVERTQPIGAGGTTSRSGRGQ